jgi:hypothetical protein
MDFQLHPSVKFHQRSNDVLAPPRQLLIDMLNRSFKLNRFKDLYVASEFSGILSRLHRNFTDLEIRSGFTAFQLITTLEKAHNSLIIVEYDPLQREDAQVITDYISNALKKFAYEARGLPYSSIINPFLEILTRFADYIFYFDDGPRYSPRSSAKMHPRVRTQARLEAF